MYNFHCGLAAPRTALTEDFCAGMHLMVQQLPAEAAGFQKV